jgi:hypothetical protein
MATPPGDNTCCMVRAAGHETVQRSLLTQRQQQQQQHICVKKCMLFPFGALDYVHYMSPDFAEVVLRRW